MADWGRFVRAVPAGAGATAELAWTARRGVSRAQVGTGRTAAALWAAGAVEAFVPGQSKLGTDPSTSGPLASAVFYFS